MLKLIYIMFHNWSDKNLYNFPGDAFGLVGLLSGIDDRKQNFSLFIVVMSTDINHWSSDFFSEPRQYGLCCQWNDRMAIKRVYYGSIFRDGRMELL